MSRKLYNQYVQEFIKKSAEIPYKYYTKIIKDEYGAVEQKRSRSGGSKRAFLINDLPFVLHEPHGKDKPVGKWDHHNVLRLLKLKGLIRDEED